MKPPFVYGETIMTEQTTEALWFIGTGVHIER